MKLSLTYLSLATLCQLVAPVAGNAIMCSVMDFISSWAAPQLKNLIFQQVKDDIRITTPLGGEIFMDEPGDPAFDGCTFSIPMNMGLDSPFIDFDNIGIFTVEGTLQPWSLLRGQVCLEDVQVVDYKIEGIDLNLDELLGGQLPPVGLSDQACMSLLETVQLAINGTSLVLGREEEEPVRRLRQHQPLVAARNGEASDAV